MHRITSHYPVSVFIKAVFENSGQSVSEFAIGLGYKNIAKGIRNLDRWLQYGEGSIFFLKSLGLKFNVSEEQIENLIRETELLKNEEHKQLREKSREERRRSFTPYIFIESSQSRPSSITIAGMMGVRMKFIKLDENNFSENCSTDEMFQKVKIIIREHMKKTKGKCLLFGEITGFLFVEKWDRYHSFDLEGELLGTVDKEFVVPFGCGIVA
ncbi:MAG TPA: hypothetical protein PKA63_13885 [Oligoflexia bacterium]|nr:hypothetical protein [Oligoflexia bacterium]HMP49754.1 hypothetical protein [Oligoflexia bacterium]